MIKRRSLLKSGAAAAIAAPALTGFAQQTVTLKFHLHGAPVQCVAEHAQSMDEQGGKRVWWTHQI